MNLERVGFLNINWRREAIFPAQALAEAILVAPWWLALLVGARHIPPERAVGSCLVLILGTLYLTRAMEALRIHELMQRAVILAGLIAASAIVLNTTVFTEPQWANWAWLREPARHASDLLRLLPEEVIVVLGVTWLFWRGLQSAQRPINVEETMKRFQIGVIVLSLFAVVSTERDITLYVPAYFFCQLLAVGLARIETIAHERGGKRPPRGASGWWLAVLTGSTGLVIVVAGAISGVVLGIGPEQLVRRLMPILSLIILPFLWILTPVLWLLGWLVEAILRPLTHWVMTASLPHPEPFKALPEASKPLIDLEPVGRVIRYGSNLLVIALVLAAVLGVVWVVGRRRNKQAYDESEQYESVWSGRALLNKLRAQVQRRWARLRNLANIAGRFGAGGLFTALTIRRIYAQTVQLAASRGYPRPAAHTPYEHLTTLYQAFPGREADLAQVTEAYVGVHYGELPEQPAALAEIRAAFDRIKAIESQGDKETR